MKKLFKLLGLVFGGIFLVGALAIVFLLIFVNPNQFKTLISQQVYKTTGRTLTINGDINWEFFPTLKIAIKDASLSNPKSFAAEKFATIGHAEFGVELLPLLFEKKITPTKIILENTKINLATNIEGKKNWENFSAATSKPSGSVKKNSWSFAETIPTIVIKNSSLGFENNKTKKKTNISNLNLTLEPKEITSEAPFKLSFSLDKNTFVKTDGKINFADDGFTVKIYTLDFNNKNIKASAGGDIIFSPKQIRTESFHITVNDSTITGEIIFTNFDNGMINSTATGEIAVDKIVTKNFLATKIKGKINGKNSVFQISPLTAIIYGGKFNGNLGLDFSKKSPQFFIKGNLNSFSAQQLFGKKITGSGNLSLNLTALPNAEILLKTLSGNISFNIKSGKMLGVNVPNLMRQGLAVIQKKPMPGASKSNSTDFGTISGSGTVRNGIIYNNNFYMNSADAITKGSGNANLVSKRLNFEMDIRPKGDPGTLIPILISGSFDNPQVGINSKKILQAIAEKAIFQRKNTIQKGIQNQLEQFKAMFD